MAILEWGQSVDTTLERLNSVEEELMERSWLFPDPVSYREGVGAATQALRAIIEGARVGYVVPSSKREAS